jgi:hypothetical protein
MNLDFRSEMALAGAYTFAARRHDGHTCAECSFAQLFAVQPGALCAAPGSECFGKHMSVTQPACRRYAARPAGDTALAEFLVEYANEPAKPFARAS